MQIVINVPENTYRRALKDTFNIILSKEIIVDAIVLPVGHGRLIDEQDAIDTLSVMFSGNDEILNDALECIEQLPEVIEADGGDTDANSD